MHKLSKGQLERRKKRRERNKPVRHAWRQYFKKVVRQYNATGTVPRMASDQG